jgi:hypothetical protein
VTHELVLVVDGDHDNCARRVDPCDGAEDARERSAVPRLAGVANADHECAEFVRETVQRGDGIPNLGVAIRVPRANVVRHGVDDEKSHAPEFTHQSAEFPNVVWELEVLLDDAAARDVGAGGDKPGLEVDLGGVLARDEENVSAVAADPGGKPGEVRPFPRALSTREELEGRALPERPFEPLDRAHVDLLERCRDELSARRRPPVRARGSDELRLEVTLAGIELHDALSRASMASHNSAARSSSTVSTNSKSAARNSSRARVIRAWASRSVATGSRFGVAIGCFLGT